MSIIPSSRLLESVSCFRFKYYAQGPAVNMGGGLSFMSEVPRHTLDRYPVITQDTGEGRRGTPVAPGDVRAKKGYLAYPVCYRDTYPVCYRGTLLIRNIPPPRTRRGTWYMSIIHSSRG